MSGGGGVGVRFVGGGLGDLTQENGELVCRQGLAAQKSLDLIASVMAQEFQLFLRFHAFGDDIQAELLRHSKDSGADCRIILVGMKILYERAVDLQCIDRKSLQVTE